MEEDVVEIFDMIDNDSNEEVTYDELRGACDYAMEEDILS